MKKYVLLMFFVGFGFFANGSNLVLKDSIGIQKIGDQTFIQHLVTEKETLFGISRRYETSVNDLILKNEELKQGLKIGQKILIPYIAKSEIPVGAKVHKVAAGETLFAISKAYNISVGEIMSWNKLKGNDLSVGQALIIEGAALASVQSEKPVVSVQKPIDPANTNANQKTAIDTKKAVEKAVVKEKTNVPEVKNTAVTPSDRTTDVGEFQAPGNWITHTVDTGETLFGIAAKYDAKMGDLINWNTLSSNNLSVGQKLKVGRESAGPSTVPVIKSTIPVIVNNERVDGTLSNSGPSGSGLEYINTGYKNNKQTG